MCSDICSLHVDVKPDYNKEWHELFRNVIEYTLGPSHIITTLPDREQACITASGSVLGYVSIVNDEIKARSVFNGKDSEQPFPMWCTT